MIGYLYSDAVAMRPQQYWGQVTQSTNEWEDVEDEPKVISRFIFSKKKGVYNIAFP
jgi:hypothetical protein